MARVSEHLGGSDIAAIRGENPWKTPRDVWKRIVHGVAEPPAGLPAELGKAAEEPILVDYCVRHDIDRGSMERNVEVWSDAEPHFRGELDGLIRGERYGLDAKLVLSPQRAKLWGQEGTDEMPMEYLTQMAWYSMLADVERMVVVAIIFGRPLEFIYRRTPGFEAMLLDDARRFWRDHVEAGVPPQAVTADDAAWLNPAPTSDVRPATPEEVALVARWREARNAAELSQDMVDRLKAQVCDAIGASDGLWLGGDDRVTWRANRNGVRSLKG